MVKRIRERRRESFEEFVAECKKVGRDPGTQRAFYRAWNTGYVYAYRRELRALQAILEPKRGS
jgi:hypothetical protein